MHRSDFRLIHNTITHVQTAFHMEIMLLLHVVMCHSCATHIADIAADDDAVHDRFDAQQTVCVFLAALIAQVNGE